jgi:hypothetical protein
MVSPTDPVGDKALQMDESEDGGAIPIGFGVDSSSQLEKSCAPPTGAPSSGWAWPGREQPERCCQPGRTGSRHRPWSGCCHGCGGSGVDLGSFVGRRSGLGPATGLSAAAGLLKMMQCFDVIFCPDISVLVFFLKHSVFKVRYGVSGEGNTEEQSSCHQRHRPPRQAYCCC